MLFGKTRPERRIGWIIGDQLEQSRFYYRIDLNVGGISLTRYNWIARYVNAHPATGLRYEIYRPWKTYQGLLLLKSMGEKSVRLVQAYQRKGKKTIFDANVNYYEAEGNEYYSGMLPSDRQIREAVAMTRLADGVIADSEFLQARCAQFNDRICWIPDNVDLREVPPYRPWKPDQKRWPLLWSGESVKLFELLAIREVLEKYARHFELVLITNDLAGLDRLVPAQRTALEALLGRLRVRIIPFETVSRLLDVYARGGIMISPRFLDNSYNWGHTEWKITLPLACGRLVWCSPVPSYTRVAERSNGRGLRLCRTGQDWEQAFEEALSGQMEMDREEPAARQVVEKYYSTPVVAEQHAAFVRNLLNG